MPISVTLDAMLDHLERMELDQEKTWRTICEEYFERDTDATSVEYEYFLKGVRATLDYLARKESV